MDIKTQIKVLKICGIVLVVCGAVGFFYVMYSGQAAPKDTLITVIFVAAGIYSFWLGNHPDKLTPKK